MELLTETSTPGGDMQAFSGLIWTPSYSDFTRQKRTLYFFYATLCAVTTDLDL